MILKKVNRSKKAITPVISTLLLILLSVAAGLVLYSYVMGYMASMTKSSTSTQGMLSLDSASAAVGPPMQVVAYIRNVGGVSVTISSAYVNNVVNSAAITVNPAGAIAPGTVSSVTIPCTGAGLTKGISATVKVVGTDGTSLAFTVTP